MLYDIWKEESEIKYGSEQRLELRKLLENYRTNPSNGNRHEQAVCDFIESSSTTSLIRVLEGTREMADRIHSKKEFITYLSEQIELIKNNE